MVDETPAVRSAVVGAFDSGVDARNGLHMVTLEPPAWRWTDFIPPYSILRKFKARYEVKPSSLQVENAAFACQHFAQQIGELLQTFPDAVLADATRSADSWKERVWSATDETREVSREVNAAVEIVSGFLSDLNRGRVLKARGA